jgi:CheY-like chemotaxis protein
MPTANYCHSRPRVSDRSILVIDDETSIQTLLMQILADEGYHVRAVRTARHALNVIRDEGFDVVISDISLPDVDGVELVRQICSEFPHISVIAMSGFMAAIPSARLHDAGTAATLQKPFTAPVALLPLGTPAPSTHINGSGLKPFSPRKPAPILYSRRPNRRSPSLSPVTRLCFPSASESSEGCARRSANNTIEVL